MTVREMKIGERLLLGSYASSYVKEASPISWLKATRSGTFLSEFVLDLLQYDAAEMGDNAYRYELNANYELSNIRQFLNASGPDWFQPTHPKDTASYSMRTKNGFLTDFEDYEEKCIISGIQLPASEDIFGVNRFELFRRKGVRGRASEDLLIGGGGEERRFFEYMTQTVRSYNSIGVIDRSGNMRSYNPNVTIGVRPKCSVSLDTEIELSADGTYYVIAHTATAARSECTIEDIKTLLGLL